MNVTKITTNSHKRPADPNLKYEPDPQRRKIEVDNTKTGATVYQEFIGKIQNCTNFYNIKNYKQLELLAEKTLIEAESIHAPQKDLLYYYIAFACFYNQKYKKTKTIVNEGLMHIQSDQFKGYLYLILSNIYRKEDKYLHIEPIAKEGLTLQVSLDTCADLYKLLFHSYAKQLKYLNIIETFSEEIFKSKFKEFSLSDKEQLIKMYTVAIDLKNENQQLNNNSIAETYLSLFKYYISLGVYKEAQEIAIKGLSLDKIKANYQLQFIFNLITAYKSQEHYVECIQFVLKMLDNPSYKDHVKVRFYSELSDLYFKTGQFQKAQIAANEGLSLTHKIFNHPPIDYEKGNVNYTHTQDNDEALKKCQEFPITWG